MTIWLPEGGQEEGEGGEGMRQHLTRDDLSRLLLASWKKKRMSPGSGQPPQQQQQAPSPPHETLFGSLWQDFLSRHPCLHASSETLPQRTLALLAGTEPVRFLYVMQHEWAVVPGPSRGGPDFIASDDATTCHVVGAFNRQTGMIGVCHLDHPSCVQDLPAFEAALLGSVATAMPTLAADYLSSSPPIDLYITGGFMEAQSEELSAAVLHHFHTSRLPYQLRVARISSGNTEVLLDSGGGGLLSPVCRSFGFRCQDGACFSGPLPSAVRGPARRLRAARIFADSPQPLTPLHYDVVTKRVHVTPFPFSRSSWQRRLLQMNNGDLLSNTSTSSEVEAPHFVSEMRETLTLLYTTKPSDYWVEGGQEATFDVPRVKLRDGDDDVDDLHLHQTTSDTEMVVKERSMAEMKGEMVVRP